MVKEQNYERQRNIDSANRCFDPNWLASKHSDVGNVLSKSQGDFATQLKSHLQNESDLMVEVGSYYRQLASVLTHTVNEYSRVDNELSKSYGLNQEGGSQ